MRIVQAETEVVAKWALYVSMALVALCVVLLTVFSNHYDWDAFYALAEVDYRAWWVDHELPLWSYQLCAGISRIADPFSSFYMGVDFRLFLGIEAPRSFLAGAGCFLYDATHGTGASPYQRAIPAGQALHRTGDALSIL